MARAPKADAAPATVRVRIALPGPATAKVFTSAGTCFNKQAYDLPEEEANALIQGDRAIPAGSVADEEVATPGEDPVVTAERNRQLGVHARGQQATVDANVTEED